LPGHRKNGKAAELSRTPPTKLPVVLEGSEFTYGEGGSTSWELTRGQTWEKGDEENTKQLGHSVARARIGTEKSFNVHKEDGGGESNTGGDGGPDQKTGWEPLGTKAKRKGRQQRGGKRAVFRRW